MSLSEIRLKMGPRPMRQPPAAFQQRKKPPMDPQVRRSGGVRFPPKPKRHDDDNDDDDDDDDDDDALYDSSRTKKYYTTIGPHSLARRSNMLLYFCFFWLVLLTVVLVIHFAQRPGHSRLAPVLEVKKESSKWHVPFNLVPDNGTNGRIMTLDVRQMNFKQLLRYDVCCQQESYYVCRTVSKNLGIECYLTRENKAVVHINHPDMVGARCTLMWIEKR